MEGMQTMQTMATKCFLLDIEYDILLHMEVDVDVSRLLLEQGSIGKKAFCLIKEYVYFFTCEFFLLEFNS